MKKPLWYCLAVLALALIYAIGALAILPAIRPQGEAALPEMAAGERVACMEDNDEALVWRIRTIEAAQEEIILSTFAFGSGGAGRDMAAALLAAADRGVQVKILLDGYSGEKAMKKDHLMALAAHEQVEVRIYNPFDLLRLWQVNYRMHDKYLIADDHTYILGGRNTNDLFLGHYSDTPNQDRDILVYGTGMDGSMGQLRAYFAQVWDLCEVYHGGDPAGQAALRARYDDMKTVWPTAFGFTDWQEQTLAAEGVAVIAGQIQVATKAPLVWQQLCALMGQGDQVWIQTPYVICGRKMYQDLSDLIDGGTQVRILTNSPQTGANPFGCTDLMAQRRKILDTGATLLGFAGDHSLHGKTILIDDNISIVGSFNMDMRSAYLDTETMLVVDCPALNAQLRAGMEDLASQSLETAPDGTQTPGADYQAPSFGFWKGLAYFLLGLVLPPFRHLL